MTDGETALHEPLPTATHVDCTNEEYHARNEWSSSQLKCLQYDGPLMFQRRYITAKAPREQKRSWDIGTVTHAALLEPTGLMGIAEEIPRDVLSANGQRRGKVWDEWKAARPGKILLLPGEVAEVKAMIERVLGNDQAASLLHGMPGSSEFSIIWTDQATGLDLRCRLDRIHWHAGGTILIDVKTTRDVSPKGFAKQVAQLGYHNQAAFYWDGAEALGAAPRRWMFVAVQNSEPFDCVVYELHRDDIEQGRKENRETLQELARRLDADDWQPDTYGRVVPLRLPAWRRTPEPVELLVGGQSVAFN